LADEIKQAFIRRLGLKMGSRFSGGIQWLEKEKRFHFPNGSMMQVGYCGTKASDWEQYVGQQWDDIWFEQAEQWQEHIYDNLRSSNRRSTGNTTCDVRTLVTFNPGGIGSEWVRRRIVEPLSRDNGIKFFKSMVRENYATLERDPSYILRSLSKITDPILRQQWLEGDWDAKGNVFFQLSPPGHEKPGTVSEEDVPFYADWYGGVDWGRDKPFAYLIGATWRDNKGLRHLHIAAEVYVTHRELDEQAILALECERNLRLRHPHMHDVEQRWADWSTSNPIEGESTEQTRTKASVWRKYGFNTYASRRTARSSGWELLKYLIRHQILTISPDCVNLIREFKSAVKANGHEDIDQNRCEDHALDALRYMITNIFPLDFSAKTERSDYDLKRILNA
jgi:hypothetical protein